MKRTQDRREHISPKKTLMQKQRVRPSPGKTMQTQLPQPLRCTIAAAVATLALVSCGAPDAAAPDAAEVCAAPDAAEVWRNVSPAGAPGCSQGTPYSFWVKEGDPTKLAVALSGGGACWTGENCVLYGKPFYNPSAGMEQDPTSLGGIFDIENPENPLADYTIVFLPTCNGDLFLGDSVTTYDVPAIGAHPAGKMEILHKGYDNAASALEWMFKSYRSPKTVAVMGWSAGAIASPVFTHIIAQHYPDASVQHFADGAGAYRVGEKLLPLFTSWGTANVLKRVNGFEELSIDGLSFEDLYIRGARLQPNITFHQYNSRHDEIQALFMRLIGVETPDVPASLDNAHAYIRAHVLNFRTYLSWGRDVSVRVASS